MKISNLWVNHLPPNEREAFKEYLSNDSQITKAIEAILLRELNEVQDNMASETSYKDTDWQFLQAHRNGKLEIINSFLRLTQHLH